MNEMQFIDNILFVIRYFLAYNPASDYFPTVFKSKFPFFYLISIKMIRYNTFNLHKMVTSNKKSEKLFCRIQIHFEDRP